jgi:hypothetical protein
MHALPDKSGFDSDDETRSEAGDPGASASTKLFYKNLIRKANTVPLPLILKQYGYFIDAQNRKLICPFPKHKNGRENTPSFQYWPDTNTFFCFGCRAGSKTTDFVVNKEGITAVKAATKILELYGAEASSDDVGLNQTINYSERLEILMEFSNFIREALQNNLQNPKEFTYIENMIAFSFDKMNELHSVDNEALRRFMIELKSRISQ